MEWVEICIRELRKQKLFQSGEHESLFRDAVTCYCNRPFFTDGLCKCIYLASWDMEHFAMFLDPINTMVARGDINLDYMEELGEMLAEENEGLSEREMYLFELSEAFLREVNYTLPEDVLESNADWLEIYYAAKSAAEVLETYCKK